MQTRRCRNVSMWRTGLGRGLAWRRFALVVVHGIRLAEHEAHAAAVRPALERAHLARVRVDDDVGLAAGAHGEEAHGRLRAVDELVAAGLADGEAEHLPRLELAPAGGRAQARVTLEHDHELLLGEVEVVRVGGLAGRQVPQAQPEALGAGLPADAGTPRDESGVLARLVEVGFVEVRHGSTLR